MFVIVNNNSVVYGPKDWSKKTFEEVLVEDCDVNHTLELKNDNNDPVIISDQVMILPVVSIPQPYFDSRIERLDGPFWNFNNNSAEMYYTVGQLPIDAIKNFFVSKVADIRYVKEVGGIKQTVQGIEVTIDTMRGSRDIFFQAYLSIGDTETIKWKFPETWMDLTKSELGAIVSAGRTHIQNWFNWENNWIESVKQSTTIQQLKTLYDQFEQEIE